VTSYGIKGAFCCCLLLFGENVRIISARVASGSSASSMRQIDERCIRL